MKKMSRVDNKCTAAVTEPETLQMSGSQPSPDNEDAFVLFPKLAFEVRRMIWSFALPTRRIIELRHRELVPQALEPITLMSVCAESRQIAEEAHSLFDLRPSIRAAPFYFSDENTICLLRDEKPQEHWNLWLWPPVENEKSHPWNAFREKVTILALDPLLCYGPLNMRNDVLDINVALCAYVQAAKLASAIATFPNLTQVIVFGRKEHENRVHHVLKALEYCMNDGSDGCHPVVVSSAYGKIPPVHLLDYQYRDGEDAWVAMRKTLMEYTEKALKPTEEWIDWGRESTPDEDV
jgi:hypothetical protein